MFFGNRIALFGMLAMLFLTIRADAYVNMTLQETATGSTTGVALPAGLKWIYFAHHTHTDYSDGRDTVKNRISEAGGFGADIVSICDHNSIAQCNDPAFVEQDGCIPMRANEWGGMGRGHASVLNMAGDETLDVKPNGTLYTLEEMMPQMLARGATIFINHPFDDGNGWPHAFAHAGLRGAAVWTTPFPNADARGWWAAHITQGRMLVAIGESDHHLEKILSTGISNSMVPCNYVMAASRQPADVQAALEAGRISVANSKDAARTFVWCDQNGDGVYETPMGTNIIVTQPKRLRFRVEVYGGAALGDVMVYSMNAGVKTSGVNGDPWRIDYEADVNAQTRDFVRSELRNAVGVFQSISNPIYVNYAPTCEVTGPVSPTNSPSIVFTLTFKQAVTGLTAAGIEVINGTKDTLSGSGSTYTLSVTPTGQGAVTCRVLAKKVWDGVGNDNLASNLSSVTFDSIAPTCVVTPPASPNRTSPLVFGIAFSEPVNDLTAEDIEVANGTKGALSGSGMNYSIAVTPLEQGVVTCRVPGAVALDAAGNGNDDSNQQSVTYDSVGATCTVTGTPSPTNGTPVEFTLTFNEPVTGLQSTGVTLTNGVVSGFSGSGETYTLAVMPSGEGAIGCQVPVGVALDAAGNGNTESNFLTVTYDSVGPTCVVTGPASPSNDTPVEFTLTFNEPVTGLQSGAIVVSNGVAGPVSGSGTTYMLPVTPSYQGAVSCQVPGGVALDAASNGNVESNQLNVIYDPISPAVTLESSSPDPTNAAIAVTAAFSEKTTDFAVGDIVRTNATVTAFGGNGISYFWTLTPRTQGSFSCSIPAAKFTDAAGNANSSSNVLARTFDSVSPAVVLASNSPGLTNAPITVTATLSEADTDFTAQSVTATNATVSDFAGGGLSYSWTLTAKEQGEFSCSVETGKFTDAAGNANSVSNTVTRTYDSVLPTAVLTSSSPDPTNAAITVAATLSEADADLTSEAVTTTNATLTAFSGNGLSYSWTLTPIAQGEFSCVIEAGRFADAAANVNAASNAVSRNYDSINPTLTLASVSPDFTNTAIAVTATLSEASTDFAAEGVTATNATVTGFTGSGSLYSWTLTPTGQGSFSCSVEAARFIDAAGNANTASNALARIYDSVSPTIVLNSNSPERVDTVITVTATLSEPVTDFTAQDVTATNSILSGFEGDGTSYSWTLTPAGQGTFACFVRGAKFADAAGNQNAGLVMLSRTYDSVSPSIILGSNAPDYVDAAISVTATLSEPSTDFAAQDIVATNATVSGFGGNGATYAWTLTPTAQGSFSCEVEAGRFADDVGNLNTASNTIARIHNSVPVADAGADQSGNVGVEVVLDGSGSADADGQTLAYSWTLGVPDGSGATLDDVHSAQPKFTPDARGVYRAALVVTDGLEVSAKDEIVVTVGNRAPVADAGDPQTVKVQDTVTLDGTGSYDLDGDSLTYAWTLSLAPAESTVVLDAADTPHASFVVDKPGDYTILLIVSDGVSKAESIPAAVVISTQNSVPIAEAGPDQTTRVGEPVTLDGSGSYDVDSDTLTYRWEIVERPEGSTVALDFPDMLSSQIVPDKKGQFVIQLVVDDGVSEARSEPDRVTVTTENSAPVADAGPPQTIHAGQIATVDASGSYDRDGDSIIYAWSISSRPEGSLAALSDASAVRPTFVADKLGEYILQLIVNDGFAEATSPDTVVVTTENSIPVAEAGLPRTVYVGDTVTVDGSASQDSDGDALGYNWSIISRPADSAAKLEHADAVEATFVADRTGDYVLQLIVDDGVSKSPSQPDTVTITTECSTPVANAGPDQDATVGGPVTLDGSDSPEANGEPLTYTWALLSVPPGSTAQLDRETSATPEFSPDVAGVYVAQLTVNDSCGDSLPDTVVVTVGAAEEGETPEGAPLDGESPEGIVLDGEAPDGEVLPEGAALEGERPEGAIPDGETVEGEAVDGEILEGEPVDGEAVEGQISDGEPPEGQTEEDQTREGLPSEGDTPAASIGCTVV